MAIRYYKKTFTENGKPFTFTTSSGNEKLKENNSVGYIIFNLPARKTCPKATGECWRLCYAVAAERYDGPRAMRSTNYDASRQPGFETAMIEHINYLIGLRSYRAKKHIVIRVHESGDFYSQVYFNAWLNVAEHFKDNRKLHFVAYTKSVDFVPENWQAIRPRSFVVRFSLWNDTEPAELEKARARSLPIYSAVARFSDEPARVRCGCVNCSTCFKCFSDAYELLLCEVH